MFPPIFFIFWESYAQSVWSRRTLHIKLTNKTLIYNVGDFPTKAASVFFNGWFGRFMVFNAAFNNISVILWHLVLLVEETRVPGENHRHVANY